MVQGSSLPLAGVRVVEFGQFIAAPGAAMSLADLGAEVIKVESVSGDSARSVNSEGQAPMFVTYNRGKRSVALNLRSASGVEAARRLALSADVLIHNTRGGVMEAIGLDAASLRAQKPSLIHASISGFGSSGPSRTRPGLDIAAQAESGMMSVNGELGGTPLKVGFTVIDATCALATSNAVMAALLRRAATGEGETIEISLLAIGVQLQGHLWAEYEGSGVVPTRSGNCQPKMAPAADVIVVADGHIVLSAPTQAHWVRLCKAIGQAELASDARFATNEQRVRNRPALLAVLDAALGTMTGEAARQLLERHDVVVGEVRNYQQVMASADVQATGIFTAVDVGEGQTIRIPGRPYRMASLQAAPPLPTQLPQLGQHTGDVLAELGYSAADLAQLHAEGAIAVNAMNAMNATNTMNETGAAA